MSNAQCNDFLIDLLVALAGGNIVGFTKDIQFDIVN